MRTIAITNQKGGCGKTTTAINLAAALAARGQRVLLIDLDPQAHASLGLGCPTLDSERPHLYHVLSDAASPRAALRDIVVAVDERLSLAPGHIVLSTLEQELAGQEGGITRLADRLREADGQWDVALIDTPPSLGFLTFNALRAASEVIVPIETSTYALHGVAQLRSMLDLVRVKTNHRYEAITALVTLFDERSRYARQMLGLIRSSFQHQVFTTLIRQSVALREAASAGRTVLAYQPDARASLGYLALADEVLQMAPKPALDPQQFVHELRAFVRRVTVGLRHHAAATIYIAGEFNDWKLTPECTLTQAPHDPGRWVASLELAPGRYRYKFVVDGQWIEDPDNPHRAANAFGTADSLLIVE